MALFTSTKERHLWLWTLAVMVAIYTTLGTAGSLAKLLREHNLLAFSNAAAALLVAALVAWRWLRNRPGHREIGAALAVAFAYWWSWFRIQTPEERTHLLEYGIVAALVYQALLERRRNGRKVKAPAVLAWAITAGLGWIDEGIQMLLPGRVYDIRDVGFNALAAAMAIGATLLLDWARRKRRNRS